MPFGVVSGVDRGMGVLDGVVIVEGEEAVFGVSLGRPIVTNWAFATRSSQITLMTCSLWLWNCKANFVTLKSGQICT